MKSSLGALLQGNGYAGGFLAGVIASVIFLAIAWPFVDHMPLYDELLHFLAARNVRDHGLPMIADGFYERARLFTTIVAGALTAFGDTLAAARIPSLVSSAGLLIAMTVWVTRRVDLLAGIVAATVLGILPATLDLAVFARFYMLHALLVFGMVTALFEAAMPGRSRRSRIAFALLAGILLVTALQLQVTTLIALAAAVAGVGVLLVTDHWPVVWSFARRHPVRTVAGSAVALAAGFWLLWSVGFIAELRSAPLWLSGVANRYSYYPVSLAKTLPLFWPLFPVAVVLAYFASRRVTVFCLVVFLIALAIHSVAASKSLRYVYYALPFFAVIWGCAVSGIVGFARKGGFRSIAVSSRGGVTVALVLAAVVAALSQEGQRTAKLVLGRATLDDAVGFAGEADWSTALPVLRPLVTSSDRVVASNSMKALYYLGRYDYEANASSVLETVSRAEFGTDPRTGRQAIGTGESMAQVLAMAGRTAVILEEEKMGRAVGIPAAAVDEVVSRCTVVAVPASSGIRAWTCPAVDGQD